MLVLAREYMGMTQKDLALSLGVTQGHVSKIEDGLLLNISDELLEKAASVLQRPRSFFSLPGAARAACESFYRKKSALPKSVLRQCDAAMNIRRLQIERLASNAEFDTQELPYCDPSEFRRGPAEIAQHLRRLWKLPRGPIQNLTEVVENAGCVVVWLDFGTLKLDGVSLLGADNTPIIFLNPNFPPDRMRFTLAHELGHLVMHRLPSPEMEEQAHAFASEFLMPESEIRSSFYPISLDRLARLKLYWRVSMAALLKRGTSLGAIGERYSRFLWMQMGKYGYRQTEPHEREIPVERPRLLLELVDVHFSDLEYTRSELAAALAMTNEDLDETYLNHSPLRVVQ